jgi:type I restriction enzyme S subunit
MGTAGWLISGYNMFKNYFKNRLDVSGGEVEPETFQYSLMNIILTLHKFPDDIRCNSSLTHVNSSKHHLILTNPPFNSKKQIKFDQIKKNFENDEYTKKNKIKIDDIYTLKKDDPPIQFLELDTYKLDNNGMCIIVLPYGEFFSGSSFSKTREHFLETVNISDIILIPGGIFTHTGIKTCVMIYEKNGNKTENINFLKVNQECNNIEKITTVKIDDIQKEQNNSWYHTDYLIDNFVTDLSKKMNNFYWIELGKLFTFNKGKIQSSNIDYNINGKIPVISIAKENKFAINIDANLLLENKEHIFIVSGGNKKSNSNNNYDYQSIIKYYDGVCVQTNLLTELVLNNTCENINLKYIYYYLKSLKSHIDNNYAKGAVNQILDQKNFNRMKIPIPPLEIQTRLITKLDSSNNKVKYMNLIIDSMKQDIETFFELTIEIENKNKATKWVEFGNVFTLEKGKLQSSKVEEDEDGDGVMVTQSKNQNDYKKIKKWYLDGENLFVGNIDSGRQFCIIYYEGKCDYTNLLLLCKIKENYNKCINIKYIYYYLKSIQNHLTNIYLKGSCNLLLDKKNFNRMKIPIPPIEQQNKCIEKINEMENIIKRWNKDVDNILNNGSNKFLEYLESESIKYKKN